MRSRGWSGILALVLALAPQAARGQCMGGGGMSHDHAQEAGSKSEKKMRKAIRQALSDPRGRDLVMEEVFGDSEFMRTLIERMAVTPEWRALAAERLAMSGHENRAGLAEPGVRSVARSDSAAGRERPAPGATERGTYSCPMHPEVASPAPGKCPKCGMTLERSSGGGRR